MNKTFVMQSVYIILKYSQFGQMCSFELYRLSDGNMGV